MNSSPLPGGDRMAAAHAALKEGGGPLWQNTVNRNCRRVVEYVSTLLKKCLYETFLLLMCCSEAVSVNEMAGKYCLYAVCMLRVCVPAVQVPWKLIRLKNLF